MHAMSLLLANLLFGDLYFVNQPNYFIVLTDHILSIFCYISCFTAYKKLIPCNAILIIEYSEYAADSFLGLHVSVVGRGVYVIDAAAEHGRLDRVIHQVVCVVVRLAHVRAHAQRGQLELGRVEGRFEVRRVHLQVQVVVLRTPVEGLCAHVRRETSQSIRLGTQVVGL